MIIRGAGPNRVAREMKYWIVSFFCSGHKAQRGVVFRYSARNASTTHNNWYMYRVDDLNCFIVVSKIYERDRLNECQRAAMSE